MVTTKEIYKLSKSLHLEMPITQQVYNVIYNGHTAQECVDALLGREPVKE